jgi:hypothetical protein
VGENGESIGDVMGDWRVLGAKDDNPFGLETSDLPSPKDNSRLFAVVHVCHVLLWVIVDGDKHDNKRLHLSVTPKDMGRAQFPGGVQRHFYVGGSSSGITQLPLDCGC